MFHQKHLRWSLQLLRLSLRSVKANVTQVLSMGFDWDEPSTVDFADVTAH
jgi:hypothetical protein